MAPLKTLILQLLPLSLFCAAISAVPAVSPINGTTLVKRDGESRHNPVELTINIHGWENTAEQDCFAWLCIYGGRREFQHSPSSEREDHYQSSGAKLRPFRASQLSYRGTRQITSETISAEETLFESMAEAGLGRTVVFPTTRDEQGHQAIALSTTIGQLATGTWFRPHFRNWDEHGTQYQLGPYCRALMLVHPPDTSVCGKKEKVRWWGVKVSPWDYEFLQDKRGKHNSRLFSIVKKTINLDKIKRDEGSKDDPHKPQSDGTEVST